jgi:mxaD protein
MMPTIVSPFRRSLLAAACLAGTAALRLSPAHAAQPVLNYKSEITLKASPQKAWNSFKTFSANHEWHPVTEGTKLLVGEDGKPLAVREFQLKGGGFVISELLTDSEVRRRFTYTILKASMSLANYVGEMWVTPAAGGAAVGHWSATFQRPEENAQPNHHDAVTTKLVQGVFKAGLDNIGVITAR